MKHFDEFLRLFRGTRTDVIGVDQGTSGTKLVRLKQSDDRISIVAADILPPARLATPPEATPALVLPRQFQSRYAAIASSAPGTIVKLLTLPLHSDKPTDVLVSELMGLGDSMDYRVGYEHVSESRTDRKILSSAILDATACSLCRLFPSGTPAPYSIEIAGLASMTSFTLGPGAQHKNDNVAVIDFGEHTSFVAFFNKGNMCLIRRFDFGSGPILKRLQESLGIDADVALGILNDQSFDISQVMKQSMEGFLQQITISWDFVERRENSPISHLYACGGMASLKSWAVEVQQSTGQEPRTWNPFDAAVCEDGSLLSKWRGQEPRFAAAMGAAISVLGNR